MDYPVTGVHHITLCAGGAQEDIDFSTQVLGQRLIKQTVLFDGRYAHYHLYYANANAEPGSVMTTFPYNRVKGRPGSGQIAATSYTVPKGTVKFWADHAKHHKAHATPIQERFGQKFMWIKHPSGLEFEVIEDVNDDRKGWVTDEISEDVSMHGFHGAVLSVREIPETERFFTEALGFRKTGSEGAFHRFEVRNGGAARTVTLVHEPEKPAGSWTFGAGTGHHLALDVPNDEGLAKQKEIYEELGYTDCSEIKDRNYFHSIYCRCPGGILVECAATAPGGFAKDEPFSRLGTQLLLPPWFEHRRDEIMAMLEPITVPESNQLPSDWRDEGEPPSAAPEPVTPAEAGHVISPSRRTSAEFVKPEKK
jgi:glyoxalase family protein